jgi:Holliday junction resolvase RusA-like endonuclease
MIFRLPRPAGHYRTGRFAGELKDSAPHYPDKKPDLDKLIRSTSDGLKEGGAFHDDSQIVTVQAFKIYARLDEAPGVDISITLA